MKYIWLFLLFVLVGIIVVAVAYATAGFAEVLSIQELKEKENESINRDDYSIANQEDL